MTGHTLTVAFGRALSETEWHAVLHAARTLPYVQQVQIHDVQPDTALQASVDTEWEVIQDCLDAWFVQGGASLFGPLVNVQTADDLIAAILARVLAAIPEKG